ncbi:MAG: hypothetical protein MZV70_35495 [Desulfobacterales bacterium]|nr:hypothetical protein [Desulfobacterales bacterium]
MRCWTSCSARHPGRRQGADPLRRHPTAAQTKRAAIRTYEKVIGYRPLPGEDLYAPRRALPREQPDWMPRSGCLEQAGGEISELVQRSFPAGPGLPLAKGKPALAGSAFRRSAEVRPGEPGAAVRAAQAGARAGAPRGGPEAQPRDPQPRPGKQPRAFSIWRFTIARRDEVRIRGDPQDASASAAAASSKSFCRSSRCMWTPSDSTTRSTLSTAC